MFLLVFTGVPLLCVLLFYDCWWVVWFGFPFLIACWIVGLMLLFCSCLVVIFCFVGCVSLFGVLLVLIWFAFWF